jgi:serine/threonine protein kinase/tetratricopeptide (TPR) repeat protein
VTERELHERASALFLEVRLLHGDARAARLQEAAGGDERLRREVLSLLEHDERETLVRASPADAGAPSPAAPGAEAGPPLPERIGPYTVIRRIGRGGSGYVLLAEQRHPVRRLVAIKVVPHAAISPQTAARFEFERRALERTSHPNIARVLDAGTTDSGLPYLVMDYVQGVPITEHCRRRSLGLRARIELFLQVTDAVQHAHQRGVIHRDLKPGNILVSDAGRAEGGHAIAHVLDFGIAKATADAFEMGLTSSPATIGLPLGTPAYMAPEQTAPADGLPVDTRADVYALGAVLYELVCGRPPIDVGVPPSDAPDGSPPAASTPTTDLHEVIRRIREDDPLPPSRVLRERRAGGPRAGESGARGGGGRPPDATRALLADLDCILARAMEKPPERRYPTVAAMADDLRRLLRSEPIEARPRTLAYRLARLVQRKRALAAATAIGAIAVVAGVAGLTGGLLEARRQQRDALLQRDSQVAITTFLTDDLLAASSPHEEGQKVSALDLLRRASRRVDRRLADRPAVAAAVHHVLGLAFTELGAFDDADRHLARAIALRRETLGPDAPETVRSEIAAASLLGQRQQLKEAEAALAEAIRRGRLVLGADDPAVYSAMNDLGSVLETMDRGAEALPLLKESLAGLARLLGPHHPRVFEATSNLAMAYDRVGQTQEGLQLMLEALRLAEGLDDPPRMAILGLCNNIGATYQDLNRERDAAPFLNRAAQIATDLLGPDDPATLTIRANAAGLEAKIGDPAKAAEILDDVVRKRTAMLGPDAWETLTARAAYWNALWYGKRHAEAAAGYAALLADSERAMGPRHWFTTQMRTMVARALRDAGRPAEALPYAEQAAADFIETLGPDHPRTRNTLQFLESLRAAAR